MNSLEVTSHLYSHGFLSKEAAIRVLKSRDKLIKQAMINFVNEYFQFEKTAQDPGAGAKVLEFAKKLMGRGVKPPPAQLATQPTVQWGRSARNLAPLLGLAGLVALGSTAAKVGLGALGDIKTGKDLAVSFNNVFNEFPELKEDRGQTAKYFKMMSKYAPSLASNPIVAGTWIKSMMDMNVVDPKSIHQLISAQSDWEDVRSMKSPLLSFTRDFPQTKDIFTKAVAAANVGSD